MRHKSRPPTFFNGMGPRLGNGIFPVFFFHFFEGWSMTGHPEILFVFRRKFLLLVITINATYQQTQVVTDPVTGTYQTVPECT